jgi:hypothetical protein
MEVQLHGLLPSAINGDEVMKHADKSMLPALTVNGSRISKDKCKDHPITGHEFPKVERYSSAHL